MAKCGLAGMKAKNGGSGSCGNRVVVRAMFGEPKDVPGECNAHLYIGDNFGDNHATIRCSLAPGHSGPHKEEFERQSKPVTITWWLDEKEEDGHLDLDPDLDD